VQYVIKQGEWRGTALDVQRVSRKRLDDSIAEHPMPKPPLKKAADLGMPAWGDPNETVEDTRDVDYLAKLARYNADFSREMLDGIIAEAVSIPEEVEEKAREALDALPLERQAEPRKSDLLRLVLCHDDDLSAIADLVFYLSTVTHRGIAEAGERFGVTWNGQKLSPFVRGNTRIKAKGEFGDRTAAKWARYTWEAFCELTGPEQSSYVAHYRLQTKLVLLQAKR
jgi:CHAD domain-containing protein